MLKAIAKRVTQATPKYLTEHEIAVLFQVIRKQRAPAHVRDLAIFLLVYHHGLRRSEPGRMDLSDYRPDEGRLEITRCKGSKSGEYHLIPVVNTALRAYMRIRGVAPGPLFLSRNHRAISGRRLDQIMKGYCVAAGLPADKAHCHALKHSCVTHFLALTNGNIVAAQDHVGHTDIRSTQKYLHFTERDKIDALPTVQAWGRRQQPQFRNQQRDAAAQAIYEQG